MEINHIIWRPWDLRLTGFGQSLIVEDHFKNHSNSYTTGAWSAFLEDLPMAMFLQTHQDYGSTYMERIFSLAIWNLGWESFVLGGKHHQKIQEFIDQYKQQKKKHKTSKHGLEETLE